MNVYTVINEKEVFDFITAHPVLTSVLQEAPVYIHRFFPNSQLSLQVIYDPEYRTYGVLNLAIHTSLDVNLTLGLLWALDDEWLLDLPDEVRINMLVDLQYTDKDAE